MGFNVGSGGSATNRDRLRDDQWARLKGLTPGGTKGRRGGGLSTKVHAAGDALGLPVRLLGTPGQRNDTAVAHEPIEGFEADAVIADKGYDADHLVQAVVETGADAVIPPKSSRKAQRSYNEHLYQA